MPSIRANVPTGGGGLLSPGLKKLGRGVGQMARESLGRLSETASIPGKIYKGELKPTQKNAFRFAVNVAGGGLTGGFGRGGLGMGGRRLGAATKAIAKQTIPDEELILGRLSDTARSQYKVGRSKFLKKKMDELTSQFQKQTIKHGGIPKTATEARSIADQGLTETAGEIVKYRKMLGAMDKNWT